MRYTVAQIAEAIGAEADGDTSVVIAALAESPDHLNLRPLVQVIWRLPATPNMLTV